MTFVMAKFDEGVYSELLVGLLDKGTLQHNERTHTSVLVQRGGSSFSLDLSDGLLPVCGGRRLRPSTAAKEVAWFLMGTDRVEWLEERGCRIWSKFAVGGHVDSYGFRWREKFGRDQIRLALETLANEPSSRQVMVSAWDPGSDGLGEKAKNFPCPTHFTLWQLDGELHMSVFMRSSDAFVGLPYDVMGHALLMKAFSVSLGLKLGIMTFHLSHLHLYEPHWEMARRLLDNASYIAEEWAACRVRMPTACSVTGIEEAPDAYIECIRVAEQHALWPDYDPRPELIL